MLDETIVTHQQTGCPVCQVRRTVEVTETVEDDRGVEQEVKKRVPCEECDGTGYVTAQLTQRWLYPIPDEEESADDGTDTESVDV